MQAVKPKMLHEGGALVVIAQEPVYTMQAVEPKMLHEGAALIVIAKDQPEYTPLPASVSADGLVMTEWEPTAVELAHLMSGGRVRIWIHTYGDPLQPLTVEVAEPR